VRALVTGCAGFIGSHLTESLLRDEHEVIGVDCFNDNYAWPDKIRNLTVARSYDAFELIPLDLARGELRAVVDGADVVFHLAAEPGVRTSWGARFDSYLRNNVLATQRLLEVARDYPDLRFVYASSSSIYGDAEELPTREDATPAPFSPYGVSKLAAEQLCTLYHRNHGSHTVSLRYFSVYGPRQRPDMAFNRFCRAALEGRPITVFGDGEQTRDFTFVHDVVRATRAAGMAPAAVGNVFNVGGGSRVSVNDALELLRVLADRPLDVRYEARESGDVRDTGADTTRARRDLGFAPRTPFADGLRAEWEWTAAVAGFEAGVRAVAR
jgi:UDP-glucuronate 4-epimerase